MNIRLLVLVVAIAIILSSNFIYTTFNSHVSDLIIYSAWVFGSAVAIINVYIRAKDGQALWGAYITDKCKNPFLFWLFLFSTFALFFIFFILLLYG
jgi:hypothetical protein